MIGKSVRKALKSEEMPPKMVKCSIIEGAPLDISGVDNVPTQNILSGGNAKNGQLEKGKRSAKIGVPNSKPGRRSTIPTSDGDMKEAEAGRYLKRKRENEDGPIDLKLMKALGLRGSNGQQPADPEQPTQKRTSPPEGEQLDMEDLQALCGIIASSEQSSNGSHNGDEKDGPSSKTHRINAISQSPSTLTATTTSIKYEQDSELVQLQKRALKMQIEKDEAKRDYYRLKLDKLRVEILQGGGIHQ